jgi:prolyl oligopeptidase
MHYPPAHRLPLVDVLHGVEVADPYRWLEDAGSERTQAWSAAQDELLRAWLAGAAARDGRGPGWSREVLRGRLEALMAAGMVTVPRLRGERAFFLRRRGEQQHPVLLVREPDGGERVLVDPSALSQDDTVTLDGWFPSLEGTRLAYQLSQGGDEEASLWVLDVDSGTVLEGPIDRTRYCPLAWLPGGEEFFYGRRLPPEQVPEGEAAFHRRVWRHRVGADPAGDAPVFGEGRDKTEYHALSVSDDGRWLVVSAAAGTAPRNDLYIADLHGDGVLRPVQEGVDAETHGRVERDGRLWLRTNLGAPRFKVVTADPLEPAPERWHEVIPESGPDDGLVLDGFVLTGDAVVVAGTRHAVGQVRVHDRDGTPRATVPLPGLGSVAGLSARPEGGDEVWLGYTDFTTPPRTYRYQVSSGSLELWMDAPGAGRVDAGGVVAAQQTYRSKDGTEVRMFVLHRAGVAPDGDRPTILYGYGGFNVALTPAYSAFAHAWVEQGGVYAIANLRGGSEEGETWHRAGMREHKQNVFDDFAAAAEHLIAWGWTRPERLAIYGGSNGGLLVGVALTQRPELFRAVVCSAPLLDMVRYERFGLGETWNDEYGRADDPTEFRWLYSYSPYHHVRRGTRYPAVLFTVFDSDTRVDPLHARKLCAALQWATSASPEERPVLLRRERDAGHGARSVRRAVDLSADMLAFIAHQLGLTVSAATAVAAAG